MNERDIPEFVTYLEDELVEARARIATLEREREALMEAGNILHDAIVANSNRQSPPPLTGLACDVFDKYPGALKNWMERKS